MAKSSSRAGGSGSINIGGVSFKVGKNVSAANLSKAKKLGSTLRAARRDAKSTKSPIVQRSITSAMNTIKNDISSLLS